MLYVEIIQNLFRTIPNVDLLCGIFPTLGYVGYLAAVLGIYTFIQGSIPKGNLQKTRDEYFDYENHKIIVIETYVINNVDTRLFQLLWRRIYNKVLLLSTTNKIKCEISGFDNLKEVNIDSFIEIRNRNKSKILIKNLYKYLNMYNNKFTIIQTSRHNIESKISKNETATNIVIKNDSNYVIKNYYFETSVYNYRKLRKKLASGEPLENDKIYKCYINSTLDPKSIKHINF